MARMGQGPAAHRVPVNIWSTVDLCGTLLMRRSGTFLMDLSSTVRCTRLSAMPIGSLDWAALTAALTRLPSVSSRPSEVQSSSSSGSGVPTDTS